MIVDFEVLKMKIILKDGYSHSQKVLKIKEKVKINKVLDLLPEYGLSVPLGEDISYWTIIIYGRGFKNKTISGNTYVPFIPELFDD